MDWLREQHLLCRRVYDDGLDSLTSAEQAEVFKMISFDYWFYVRSPGAKKDNLPMAADGYPQYTLSLLCTNCGERWDTSLPKGFPARAEFVTCPNCGCGPFIGQGTTVLDEEA